MKTQEFSPIKLDLEQDKMSTLKKVGIALAGLGLAGAGVLGAKVTGGESSPTELKAEPVASAPANLGENSSTVSSPQESANAPVAESPESTSTVSSSEKDADIEKSIETLATKATPEQIQWVLDHPVRADEYVTAEDRITAIGIRRNVIINSGITDHDEFIELASTIYDIKSESAYAILDQLESLTQKTTKLLAAGKDMRSPITPVEMSGIVEENSNISTVDTIVNRISPSDPSYIEGPAEQVIFTMETGSDGVVRIVSYLSSEGEG